MIAADLLLAFLEALNDDPVVQRSDVHGVRHAVIMDWIERASAVLNCTLRVSRHLPRYDDRSAFLSPAATPGPQPSPKPLTGRAVVVAFVAHADALTGTPVSRRAAQHRAARRARAGARRQLHRRPEPAAPRPQHLSALRRQRARAARRLPHAGRRCPDRAVRHRRGGMAARQLPPGHLRDPRHPPAPAAAPTTAQLPTLASREHAGHARIYAMAVELRAAQRQPARSPAARACSSTATSASRR